MHQINDNARPNVLDRTANVNHAVVAGHTAVCIDATPKRPLGRKRLSPLALYRPDGTSSRSMRMPAASRSSQFVTTNWCSATRTFPAVPARPVTAGEMPAPIWAALVICRALSS